MLKEAIENADSAPDAFVQGNMPFSHMHYATDSAKCKQKMQKRWNLYTYFVSVTGAGYYPFDRPEEIKEDFVVGSEGRTYFTNLVEDWERAATLKPEHPTR